MNFDDVLAIAEAVLLAGGLDPQRARELARGIALAERAHLDGAPLAAIKADAWRYADFEMPAVASPAPAAAPTPTAGQRERFKKSSQ